MIITNPLHSLRVTVWASVWTGGFLGPIFGPNDTVNSERFLNMLNEDVLQLLFEMPEFNEQ